MSPMILRVAAGLLLLGAVACPAEGDDRPNILLCVADDWGWPHAGAYGDEVVRTPAFDRLAREGVLFDHAFVSSPSCTPSRNALLTGQQFYRLGEGANLWSTLDVSHPTFVRLLEEAGYATGHWRKAWGPGDFEVGGYERHPCGPGMRFDRFLDQRDVDRPFLFWLGTTDPHRPYEAGSGEDAGIDPSAVDVPGFLPDVETIRADIADYYFEVQRWDGDVAAAIRLLEEAGELENTIIVMTSDNGMPFSRCKGNLYDWGARVPLAIRWGAGVQQPGREVSDFVSLIDLAPTFLEAADVEQPQVMAGQSLLPVLRSDRAGRVDEERSWVVTGRERHVPAQQKPSIAGYPSRAIRTDDYLYIMNLEPERYPAGVPEGATHQLDQFADADNGPTKAFITAHRDDEQYRRFYELCFARRPADELYDITSDPHQIHNLAADPARQETLQKLRDRLTRYLRETGDPRFTDEPVKFDSYPYRGGKRRSERRE